MASQTLDRIAVRLERFGKKLVSRSLAEEGETPKISSRRMVGLIARAMPFLLPMFVHILGFMIAFFTVTVSFLVIGAIGTDMWENKMLVNDKLQPFQAFVVAVDDTYVRTEFLSEEQLADVERQGFSGNELTTDQLKVIRNRMLLWTLFGAAFWAAIFSIYIYYPTWVWQNVNQYLRVTMIERLEYLSLSFHHTHRSGDAIYRIYQDSSTIVNVLTRSIFTPLSTLATLVTGLVVLLMFDLWLGLAVFLAFVPMVILVVYATPIIRRLAVTNRVANSAFTSRLQETFAMLKIVKTCRAEPIMQDRFDSDSQRALDAALYVRFGIALLGLTCALIAGIVIIGWEYIIVKWVIDERETGVPAVFYWIVGFSIWNLGAFNMARGQIGEVTGNARGLVGLWCGLQDLFIGLERAFHFLDLEPNVENPVEPLPFPQDVQSVSWEDVTFRYEDAKPVLEHVSLQAKAGQITAIVGGTGSGKSTMMSLLLRLYDPQQGRILVNDIDVRNFAVDSIRENNAIALQKNVLFTGKVSENIAYAQDEREFADIVAAAKIACADEFIDEMEHGYDTVLGERGSKLSTGQRQRLTIARAIIRDTSILILDEPTASLDAETEHRVLDNIAEWGRDKIVLVITHRLSTIRKADQIAFLKDGRIAEIGDHDELMAISDGHYRSFVNAETVGVESPSAGT